MGEGIREVRPLDGLEEAGGRELAERRGDFHGSEVRGHEKDAQLYRRPGDRGELGDAARRE